MKRDSVKKSACAYLLTYFFAFLASIVVSTLLSLSPLAHAQPSEAESALDVSIVAKKSLNLTRFFSVLEDPQQEVRLADITKPEVAARFVPSKWTGSEIALGYTHASVWLRLKLKNSGQHSVERMLEIDNARLGDVQLHLPQKNGEFISTFTGNSRDFATRPHLSRLFVLPLKLAAGQEQVLYLRLASPTQLNAACTLWDKADYLAYEHQDYVFQALYFGIASAMILFNLALYFALRDMLYLMYVNFSLWMSLTIAAQNGLAKQFFWPETSYWSNISGSVCIAMAMAAVVIFQRRMLSTRKHSPKLDYFLIGVLCIHLSSAVIYLFWLPETIKLGTEINTLAAFSGHCVAIYLAIRGQRSAILFVGAFSMIFAGGIARGVNMLGYVPSNFFVLKGMQIGSALEMLMLALALADRLHQILREKDSAQKQALLAQQELLANLQASEQLQEDLVKQRSAELSQSNLALEHANTELLSAYQSAEQARFEAEQAERDAHRSMQELQTAENQLIQSEKMAMLGQLLASVAEEINAPINSLRERGNQIARALNALFRDTPGLLKGLAPEQLRQFLRLLRDTAPRMQELSAKTPDAPPMEDFASAMQHEVALANLADTQKHALLTTAQRVAVVNHCVQQINVAVDSVSKIIMALKTFSHFDPKEVRIEAQLRDGLETVLTIFRRQIHSDITLQLDFAEIAALPCLPDELNQVWTALLHNALQALEGSADKRLTISLAHSARAQGQFAEICFSDSGCGITPENLDKIFDAFFTTQAGGQGNGMGLTTVKKIIDKHHGYIEVSSTVNLGTSVRVLLPYDHFGADL